MFNYLSKKIYIDKPISHINHKQQIMDFCKTTGILYADELYMSNSEFCLDGYLYDSPLFQPLSEWAQKNLFCISSLSLLESKEKFYCHGTDTPIYLLSFTYEGEGLLQYDDKHFRISRGEGFLIDCRKPHYYKTSGNKWTHIDLRLYGGQISSYYSAITMSKNYKLNAPIQTVVQMQLDEIIAAYQNILPHRELILSGRMNALFTDLLTLTPTYNQNVQNIPENPLHLLRYIHSNYNRNLTLDFLSSFSGFSKSHLNRLFHKYENCSPKEYIIRIQIERAKKLLLTTTLPVNKVGASIGIEDESYFGHLFKSRTGYSPKRFRQKCAAGTQPQI